MRRRVLGIILAAAILPAHLAFAGPDECQGATDQYILIASVVADALASYEMCILNSLGQDDCALEFSTLQTAQGDFETAVANYRSECE